ncbi:hypothetical protein NMD80_06755 [Edwardsiella tarda]
MVVVVLLLWVLYYPLAAWAALVIQQDRMVRMAPIESLEMAVVGMELTPFSAVVQVVQELVLLVFPGMMPVDTEVVAAVQEVDMEEAVAARMAAQVVEDPMAL